VVPTSPLAGLKLEIAGALPPPVTTKLLALWALHHLDYPFLRAQGAWNPWGYYLDLMFELGMGAGILMLVLEDLEAGLRELNRVLRPGGKLAVLEITRPSGILRPFFRIWFDVLVPLAGKVLPGGQAYTYLPASVRRFPGAEDLAALMERAGFEEVGYRRLGGGIVALHSGVKS